jgi:hypothetical protein
LCRVCVVPWHCGCPLAGSARGVARNRDAASAKAGGKGGHIAQLVVELPLRYSRDLVPDKSLGRPLLWLWEDA